MQSKINCLKIIQPKRILAENINSSKTFFSTKIFCLKILCPNLILDENILFLNKFRMEYFLIKYVSDGIFPILTNYFWIIYFSSSLISDKIISARIQYFGCSIFCCYRYCCVSIFRLKYVSDEICFGLKYFSVKIRFGLNIFGYFTRPSFFHNRR